MKPTVKFKQAKIYDKFPMLNGLKKEVLYCTVLHLCLRAYQYEGPGELSKR